MISILVVLLIVGFLCWAIQSAPLPLNPWFRNVITGVVILFLIIYLLNSFGFNTGIGLHLR